MYLVVMGIAVVFMTVFLSRFDYNDIDNQPKWLEFVFNLNVIFVAIILIQVFNIEITLAILTVLFFPFWLWARKQVALDLMYKDSLVYQLANTFPFLLVIFLVRSFVIQPYRVPTGSLAPTVHIGDFIVVNQYAYGVKMPIIHDKIFSVDKPNRGDIALFYWPENPEVILVKRVIGLPGDRISYYDHRLKINGKLVSKTKVGQVEFNDHNNNKTLVDVFEEYLPGGVKHKVYNNVETINIADGEWLVPDGSYFMMGDNRDNSNDSRFWGIVSDKALIGRAMMVFMNFDVTALINKAWSEIVLWRRIGQKL